MKRQKLIIACAVLLLLGAGCTRRAPEPQTATKESRSNVTSPTRVSAEGADVAEPALASAPDGSTLYLVWIEHRANREADLFVARLDGEGRSTGAPVRVNPRAGEAKGWHGDPPTIAVAPDKTVYVGWTGRVPGATGHGSNLYLSASRDEGRTFEPPVKVNDDVKPASHGMHSLAVARDGRVYLAWLDERNVAPVAHQMPAANAQQIEHAEPNSEVFFAYSTDGGRTVSPNKPLAKEACPCCKTALAVGPQQQLYVSWRQVLPGDLRHIAVAASLDAGQHFTQPVVISDDEWKITGCPVSGPALAVASDGALRAVWYTAGERGQAGLYWTESRDEGRTFSARKLVAAGQVRGNPQLLTDGGNNLVAVWESDEQDARILTARVSADGATKPSTTLADKAELPAVAMMNEALFVGYIVTSKDHRSIWTTRAKKG